MKKRLLMLKQLDRQFNVWRELMTQYQKPKAGWVRVIRKALGMTTQQLADKLKFHRSRIVKIEQAEIQDAVTLRTLKATAEAMGCELIYAFVPKKSLETLLKARALELATHRVKHVAHSMALEDQSIQAEHQKEQIEELAKTLLEGDPKKLWEE